MTATANATDSRETHLDGGLGWIPLEDLSASHRSKTSIEIATDHAPLHDLDKLACSSRGVCDRGSALVHPRLVAVQQWTSNSEIQSGVHVTHRP